MAKQSSYNWILCGLLIFLTLQLSAGLRVPRDFHPDEVWTMTMVAKSVPGIVKSVLTEDNHPPFYYLISKGWVSLMGESIPRLRIFSFVCGFLTLLSFAWYFWKGNKREGIFALGILGTNPMFNYYACTVRPYALVIFLASVMTLSALKLRVSKDFEETSAISKRKQSLLLYYGSAFLLGLTHYFGTLFVWLAIILDLFNRRIEQKPWRGILVLAVTGTWPVLQLMFGTLDRQKEANSWIKTVPFVSTMNNFLSGNFPLLMISKSIPQLTFAVVLAVVLVVIATRPNFFVLNRRRGPLESFREELSRSSFYLVMICIGVLITGLALDFILPFTTPYYFLVCLPAVTVLITRLMIKNSNQRFGSTVVAFLFTSIVGLQILLNHVGFSNLKTMS